MWLIGLKHWLAGRWVPGVGSNPAENILSFEFFASFPFRTAHHSKCKWNQAWPLTCTLCSCFRPKIRLVIQDLVYVYPQYSFNGFFFNSFESEVIWISRSMISVYEKDNVEFTWRQTFPVNLEYTPWYFRAQWKLNETRAWQFIDFQTRMGRKVVKLWFSFTFPDLMFNGKIWV